MLYVGHFRFECERPGLGPHHGEFTLLLEAEDADEAAEAMAEQILTRHHSLTYGAKDVWLDHLIELEKIPPEGVVTKASLSMGAEPVTMYASLPHNESEFCRMFGQGPDPEDDIEAAESYEHEPFLVFDEEAEPEPKKRTKPPRPKGKRDAADVDRAASEGMAQPQHKLPKKRKKK